VIVALVCLVTPRRPCVRPGSTPALPVRIATPTRLALAERLDAEPVERLVMAHERALIALRRVRAPYRSEAVSALRTRALEGTRDFEMAALIADGLGALHPCAQGCPARVAWNGAALRREFASHGDPPYVRHLARAPHGEAHDRELARAVMEGDEASLVDTLGCFPVDGARALLVLAALEAGGFDAPREHPAVRRVLSTILDRQRPDGTWDRVVEDPHTAPTLTATCVNALLLGHARARGWRAD
jgi:hypothetical protein